MAKSRPYLFYDQTLSLCPRACGASRPRSSSRTSGLDDKWCPEHGAQRVLLADDAAYWRLGREVYHQAAGDAAAFNTADALRLPLRLRALPRPHAALLPDAGRDHRPLQPRAARSATPTAARTAPHAPRACDGRAHARRGGRQRGRARRGADLAAASRRCTRSSSRSSTRRERRPIRHLMLNTNGIRIASEAGLRRAAGRPTRPASRSTCSSTRFGARRCMALRGADLRRRARAGARAAQRASASRPRWW